MKLVPPPHFLEFVQNWKEIKEIKDKLNYDHTTHARYSISTMPKKKAFNALQVYVKSTKHRMLIPFFFFI